MCVFNENRCPTPNMAVIVITPLRWFPVVILRNMLESIDMVYTSKFKFYLYKSNIILVIESNEYPYQIAQVRV